MKNNCYLVMQGSWNMLNSKSLITTGMHSMWSATVDELLIVSFPDQFRPTLQTHEQNLAIQRFIRTTKKSTESWTLLHVPISVVDWLCESKDSKLLLDLDGNLCHQSSATNPLPFHAVIHPIICLSKDTKETRVVMMVSYSFGNTSTV